LHKPRLSYLFLKVSASLQIADSSFSCAERSKDAARLIERATFANMRFLSALLLLLLCSHLFSSSLPVAATTAAKMSDEDVDEEEIDEDNEDEPNTAVASAAAYPVDPFGAGHNWVSFRDAPGVIEKQMESWDDNYDWINILNEEGRTRLMEFAIQGRVTEVQGFVDLKRAPLNFQDHAGKCYRWT
jgi:hypothetical protein